MSLCLDPGLCVALYFVLILYLISQIFRKENFYCPAPDAYAANPAVLSVKLIHEWINLKDNTVAFVLIVIAQWFMKIIQNYAKAYWLSFLHECLQSSNIHRCGIHACVHSNSINANTDRANHIFCDTAWIVSFLIYKWFTVFFFRRHLCKYAESLKLVLSTFSEMYQVRSFWSIKVKGFYTLDARKTGGSFMSSKLQFFRG